MHLHQVCMHAAPGVHATLLASGCAAGRQRTPIHHIGARLRHPGALMSHPARARRQAPPHAAVIVTSHHRADAPALLPRHHHAAGSRGRAGGRRGARGRPGPRGRVLRPLRELPALPEQPLHGAPGRGPRCWAVQRLLHVRVDVLGPRVPTRRSPTRWALPPLLAQLSWRACLPNTWAMDPTTDRT